MPLPGMIAIFGGPFIVPGVTVAASGFIPATANQSSYNFTPSIPEAHTHLILLPGSRATGTAGTITTFQVDSANVTLGPDVTDGLQRAAIGAIANSNSNPSIDITWSHVRDNMGLGWIAVNGLNSVTATAQDSDENNDPLTGSVVVSAGGIVVGVVFVSTNGSSTWTGLTRFFDSDPNIENNRAMSGAYALFASGQTVNVSVDIPNNRECLALAAYR